MTITEQDPAADGPRMHVVFVPGFGGFDALGTVEYYPGTTEVAARWRAAAKGVSSRVVLHYFDNLPTAGVNTRADRLLRYLQKRVDRNEFRVGDKIALVGHSTGGFDIRALLKNLAQAIASDEGHLDKLPRAWQQIDKKYSCAEIDASSELLKQISRVVFLSVPNRGTNIANWVRWWAPVRMSALAAAAFYVDVSDVAGAQRFDIALARFLSRVRAVRPNSTALLQALIDTWVENSQRTSDDPVLAAGGREALADLTLYLSQTHGDFLAIDDLAAADRRSWLKRAISTVQSLFSNIPRSEEADVTALARASEADRKLEREFWRDNHISTRSYATCGEPGIPPDEREPRKCIPGIPALFALLPDRTLSKTDWIYRVVYTACAYGPFESEVEKQRKSQEPDHTGCAEVMDEHGGVTSSPPIESWQNDGIVNTASMLWPDGPKTILIKADHGDIIGHYTPSIDPAYSISKTGRKYRSYDIFGSNSGFDRTKFEQIWTGVFEFCVS